MSSCFDFNSRLSKSNDDLAFIGTISLETRKQIGLRTSLSLWTDYEYISSVPEMHYANVRAAPRASATTTSSPPAPCCG